MPIGKLSRLLQTWLVSADMAGQPEAGASTSAWEGVAHSREPPGASAREDRARGPTGPLPFVRGESKGRKKRFLHQEVEALRNVNLSGPDDLNTKLKPILEAIADEVEACADRLSQMQQRVQVLAQLQEQELARSQAANLARTEGAEQASEAPPVNKSTSVRKALIGVLLGLCSGIVVLLLVRFLLHSRYEIPF